MKLIGLAGLARSGKDTAGRYIANKYNYKTYAFADPVKRACSEVFGLPLEYFYEGDREIPHPLWKISSRQMMQLLGTECVRQVIGYDTWIKRAKMEWDGLHQLDLFSSGMVITDCRFDNECQFIKSEGGVVLQITRVTSDVGNIGHESEAGVSPDLIDYDINNVGTLNDLYQQIDDVMAKL